MKIQLNSKKRGGTTVINKVSNDGLSLNLGDVVFKTDIPENAFRGYYNYGPRICFDSVTLMDGINIGDYALYDIQKETLEKSAIFKANIFGKIGSASLRFNKKVSPDVKSFTFTDWVGNQAFQQTYDMPAVKYKCNTIISYGILIQTGSWKNPIAWISDMCTKIETEGLRTDGKLKNIYCESTGPKSGWDANWTQEATVMYGVSESEFDKLL